eukprot:scaffold56240_cov38-Cyclotella_meneghiniana.AAC.6
MASRWQDCAASQRQQMWPHSESLVEIQTGVSVENNNNKTMIRTRSELWYQEVSSHSNQTYPRLFANESSQLLLYSQPVTSPEHTRPIRNPLPLEHTRPNTIPVVGKSKKDLALTISFYWSST